MTDDFKTKEQLLEELAEGEHHFRSLFENMREGVAHCRMLFDESGNPDDFVYLDVNGAFERLTGLGDVVGKRISELIPGVRVSHPGVFEIYGRVARTGRPESFEGELKPLGIWLSVSVYSNEKDHFVAVFENITERRRAEEELESYRHRLEELVEEKTREIIATNEKLKAEIAERRQAEEALRESEERWQFALEGAGEGVWDWNARTNEVFFSRRWKEMLGYAEDEIGSSIDEWDARIHPEDKEHCHAELKRHFTGQSAFYQNEHRLLCKDGSYKWILDRGKVIQWSDEGKPLRVIGTHADVTERKRLEAALRNSKERLDLALRATQEAVWDWDLSTDTMYYSPQWWNMVGYGENEMEPCSDLWRRLAHPEDLERADRIVGEAIAGGTSFEAETRLLHKAGHYVPIHTRGSVLREPGGKAARLAGTNSDLTERKRIEEERRQWERQGQQVRKAESLNRMAGAIAHHYNNLLGAVMGNLELAMDDLPRGLKPRANVVEAMKAARRAAEVSGMMLTYLGQTFAGREELDLSDICRSNLPSLRGTMQREVLLTNDLRPSGPIVNANANQVHQLLRNLIANASEAVGDRRGAVHLTVKRVSLKEIPATSRFPVDWRSTSDSYACIEVKDTGCGIPDQEIEQIFDPFFSTKFIGRGLGLPVVLGIVRSHRGLVTVESELGRGSVFRVFLPVSGEEAFRRMDDGGQAPEMEAGGTVLLVEDERMMRELGVTMLSRLGFAVLEAGDGVEALEVFRKHRDAIRCVLLDLTMPRMDGWETLKALRSLQPDLPVILASGYDEAVVMQGDHPELPQAFIHKPYLAADLKAALARMQRVRSLADQQTE